jgi:ABC-type Fe3+-siderophore transport system permease subunit
VQFIVGLFVVLLLVFFLVAHQVAVTYNPEELPKIVGAALGAAFSAAVAILLFYMARAKDKERSDSEILKFEKVQWQEVWAMMPSVYNEWVYWKANAGEEGRVSV